MANCVKISWKHYEGTPAVLTDLVADPVLRSEDLQWAIKNKTTGNVILQPGAGGVGMTHDAVGSYSLVLPASDQEAAGVAAWGQVYTYAIEYLYLGETYHESYDFETPADGASTDEALLDVLSSPAAADRATVIYEPGTVYLEQGTGYPYVALRYENQRRVNLLLESAQEKSYTAYQVFGGVVGAGSWQALSLGADGRTVTKIVLSEAAILASPAPGPFTLWDGAKLDFETLDAEGNYVTENCTFVDADFADITAATADEVAAAINTRCQYVQASSVGVGEHFLQIRSAKATDSFLRMAESDMTLALGFEFDNLSTIHEHSFRGLSGQMKRIYVRYRTGDAVPEYSAVLETWIVYDKVLPVLPKLIRNTMAFGIPLVRLDGQPMPDEDIYHQCRASIAEIEDFCQAFMTPVRIKANPKTRGLREIFDYDREEPGYDYDYRDAKNWWLIRLRQFPFISIDKIQLVYYTGQKVFEFPTHWLKPYPRTGQLQITPTGGDLGFYTLHLGGQYMPMSATFYSQRVPQYIWVDYTAGYPVGQAPRHVLDIIAKLATIRVFHIGGDATMFGISSQSLSDGAVSESVGTTAGIENALLGARIIQYKKEIDEFKRLWRDNHKGVVGVFV